MGFVQLTGLYVPARHLWACMVRRLTWNGEKQPEPACFKKSQREVNEHLRFTPLFVLHPEHGLLHPRYQPSQGLQFGEFEKRKFEASYLDSAASTSLTPGRTAEDSTLHESEFLVGSLAALTWAGGFFVRDDSQEWKKKVLELLKWPNVGGRESYGWGWLRMVEECNENPLASLLEPNGQPVGDDGGPLIKVKKDDVTIWPLEADREFIRAGQQQAVVRRDYDEGRPGRSVTVQRIWEPGAVLAGPANLVLGADHILRENRAR